MPRRQEITAVAENTHGKLCRPTACLVKKQGLFQQRSFRAGKYIKTSNNVAQSMYKVGIYKLKHSAIWEGASFSTLHHERFCDK
jgi:hypothetical protein